MKIYNGVDIIKISRIEKNLGNPRFLSRVYGTAELQQYALRRSANFLSGNFAAKEAFAKALGTGVRGFALSEVEILRDPLGAPYFKLSGKAKAIVSQRGLALSVSISHEKSTPLRLSPHIQSHRLKRVSLEEVNHGRKFTNCHRRPDEGN